MTGRSRDGFPAHAPDAGPAAGASAPAAAVARSAVRLARARYVLPHAEAALLDDGAVAWAGGRVLGVGSYAELRAAHADAACWSFPDHLILPGLINAHDHGRGLGTLQMGVSDGPLELWLSGLFTLRAIDPYLAALYDGIQLLASGVTTTTHQHNPCDWRNLEQELIDTARGYADAGIRACIGLPLMDQNTLSYVGATAFLERLPVGLAEEVRQSGLAAPLPEPSALIAIGHRLRERWRGDARHWLCWGPVGPQWCSDRLLAAVTEACRGEPVHIHVAETRTQAAFGQRFYGTTPVGHLDRIGFLAGNVTCAHGVWLREGDIGLLAARSAKVAHNPSSNLRLRSGIAPVLDLLDGGVTTGIGLDGQTLGDDQDMWTEMRLARGLAVTPGIAGRSLTARALIAMATTAGAAIVMGPGARLGAIVPDAAADFAAVRLDRVRGPYLDPRTDLIDAVVGRAKPADVDTVVVAGEMQVGAGRPMRIARADVEARLRDSLAVPKSGHQEGRERLSAALAVHLARLYGGW
jgi:cytosine/adenosine deaminase-related metal-dependent hydrolase